MKPRLFRPGGLLLVPFVAGCHTFSPVDRSALEPGNAIRITLTAEESVRQVERLGGLRTSVQGTVRDLDGPSLGLTLPADVPPPPGSPASTGLRSYVEIPWPGVAALEVKRISWARTGLLAAAAAVATVVIMDVADQSANDGSGGGGVDQQRVSIPILSFHR